MLRHPGDILITAGRIASVTPAAAPGAPERASTDSRSRVKVIDASGKIVVPGLIDLHVHLREPGFEHKETIATGCRAAVCGGFSAVCCMANTRPVNDSPAVTEYILSQAAKAGLLLCDYRELKQAGAAAVSDDGRPVLDSRIMRLALEQASQHKLLVISHSEDLTLSEGGVMNEGAAARKLGVAGIPNASESIMVLRDIALSELTGAPVHIAHVSTRESVRAIRDAKARGVPVTAETAPHYFALTDEASEPDRLAVREGLADGTIDCIATDHAPHAPAEKAAGLTQAPNGIIGLETAFPISLRLVDEGVLSLSQMIAKLTLNPARILGVPCGLTVGAAADIAILDPCAEYVIDASMFKSRSRNSPFCGMTVRGKAVSTIVGGKVVFEDNRAA